MKCKHCQSEIDEKAKICPNCRKKQCIPKWLIGIFIIVGILIVSSIISGSSENQNKAAGTTNEKEDITLLDDHSGKKDGSYSYEISGTLQNNTNSDYSYIQVEFYTYDKDGNLLDTCLDNNSGLEANGKWKFNATCFFSNADANKVASYKLKEITKW